MPYVINGQTVIPEVSNSPARVLSEKIDALRANVARLEGLRDSAVAQATNDEQRELARVALQKDVDLAQAQLTQAEQEYQRLGE